MKKVLITICIIILLTIIVTAYFVFNIISSNSKLSQGELTSEFVTDTIPFHYSCSGHILVDVMVNNNKSYPFILDSGASNFVFKRFSNDMYLEGNGFSLSQGSDEKWFLGTIKKINTVQLGQVNISDINAKEIDFDFECQENICGIIGTGVMHHFVWQIDIEKQEIIIAKKLEDLCMGENRIELSLSESKYGHHLSTKIKFRNDKSTKNVLVDIGSNSILNLKQSHLEEDSVHFKYKDIIGIASKGLGKGDTSLNYRYYMVDSLLFGKSGYLINDVTIRSATKSLDLLGLGFFEKYKTTISWPDKRLILEPYHTDQDFIDKTFGFSLQFNKDLNRAEINTVAENTPAGRFGLSLKTEVLSVNDIVLKDYKSYCMYRSADLPNDTVELKVKTKDGTFQLIELVKEPIFNIDSLSDVVVRK